VRWLLAALWLPWLGPGVLSAQETAARSRVVEGGAATGAASDQSGARAGPTRAQEQASDSPAPRERAKFEPSFLPGVGFDTIMGLVLGAQVDLSGRRPSQDIHDWLVRGVY
jgi:hypothetical protein